MDDGPFAQVKTNPRFELGWNRLQTAIEIFVGLVVAAGLLGLFGTGLISATKVAAPGGITIRYDRILRRTVQTEATIDFARSGGDQLTVEIPSSFVREMDIVSTSPRSATMKVTSDGVAYVFDTGNAPRGEITLSMKPRSFGLFDSRFRVGGTAVALRQLVWP